MKKSILAIAVAALIVAPVFAAPADSAKSSAVSMGDFAVRLAASLGTKPVDAKAAVETLKVRGARIREANLGAPVTEGEAARILSDLGVAVTTATPGKSLSAGKADQLLSAASLGLAASTVAAVELPAHCLLERNRGQCDTCCTTFLGCDSDPTPCSGGACAHFCNAVSPPGQASPSEPQP